MTGISCIIVILSVHKGIKKEEFRNMTYEIKLDSIGLQTYTIRQSLTDAASYDASFREGP